MSTAEAAGWRDIATAPKDGEAIMIWRAERCEIAYWDDDRYAKKPIPHWGGANTRAIFGPRWQKSTQPTHWMPLPEPPK